MACKLRCPKCKIMLREEGDEMKLSKGEYRVYDSLVNGKHENAKFRALLCLSCNQFSTFEEFNQIVEFYFFWKHRFGQWTMRDMVVDGVTYCCAEQYMMAEKARFFNDDATLARIMAESHTPIDGRAKRIKDLGREVTPFDKPKWDAVARDVVFAGNMAKFTQHQDLRGLLVSTGDAVLVEASPFDLVWGIGLSATDPMASDPSKWRGKNWLGEVLMRVRASLRLEHVEISGSQPVLK